MCLAVPGRIIEIRGGDPSLRTGTVDFGGVSKEINLSFVPEAAPGDYVLVHAGFALSTIDEQEAAKVFEYLREMDELGLGEIEEPDRRDSDEAGEPGKTGGARGDGGLERPGGR